MILMVDQVDPDNSQYEMSTVVRRVLTWGRDLPATCQYVTEHSRNGEDVRNLSCEKTEFLNAAPCTHSG